MINGNIKRFKNGIDLLDLKQILQKDLFSKEKIDVIDLLNRSDRFRKFAQENGLIGYKDVPYSYTLGNLSKKLPVKT